MKVMSVVLIILRRRNSLLEKVRLLWRSPLTLIEAILSAVLVSVACKRDVAAWDGSGMRLSLLRSCGWRSVSVVRGGGG